MNVEPAAPEARGDGPAQGGPPGAPNPGKTQPESVFQRALRRLARSVCQRPGLYIYPQLALCVVGIVITVGWLKFNPSRDDLVGADKKNHQNFLQYKKEFTAQDDLVVVVESEDMEKNRQFVERLGRQLEAETNLFTDVLYKGDFKMLGAKGLLFATEDDLQELGKTLEAYRPFINQFTQATNFVTLFSLVNGQFRTAREQDEEKNKSMVKALPALERIIAGAKDALGRPGSAPSPGVEALFGAGAEAEQKTYITFDHGRIFLATARAKDENSNGPGIERIRALIEKTKFEVPGVNAGLTGEPVLEDDEMAQSQHDSTVASVVSLVLCAFIFIYGYKETRRPVKATLCLLIGLGYTMAFTTLVVGHLNILTITFAPILIGLAIDFGVHFITRFEEELRLGKTPEAAIEKAMVYTGLGIITGALTTAGAFLAMGVTSFKGIQEMGIICGGGMMLCLIPMLTTLPALLLKGPRKPEAAEPDASSIMTWRARIERSWLDRPVVVALITAALCGVAALRVGRVYFNYDLLDMQSAGLPSVVFEEKLVHAATRAGLFAAVVATNLDQAKDLEDRIKKLPSVEGIDAMSQYLRVDPTVKLERIREVKRSIAKVNFAPADDGPVDIEKLSRALWALQGYLGLALERIPKDQTNLTSQLLSLRGSIVELRGAMLRDDPNIQPRLQRYQAALFSDIRGTFEALRGQDDRSGLKIEDLPSVLRHRFIGATGKYLLQVYPKENVWERGPQERFVKELQSVDENVTGTPVQLYTYTSLLKDSYEQAAFYALIAIAIMVLLHFRSLVCVILALLPVAVGSLWMGGIMGWCHIPFNPANIMTLPLVIGIGVTNGIHILNRFAEEGRPGILGKSTGKAVLVSGLTAISGFGSLILAKHQGIQSLGLVMSAGITTCMLAALMFLPALLNLLVKAGWMIKRTQ